MENRDADGSWALVQDDGEKAPQAFTPSTGDGFVEGTAAQYVWMVPFNEAGLFQAMGGTAKAAARLDRFFYDEHGAPAVTEAGPLHAELNNEPSIETPWLYDWAGQPWKTQQLVRQVLNTIWRNAPDGIPGNDDLGEMSSWAVFASMGLYPEIPGRAELVLGSPLFPSITVHRPGGDVRIVADGAAPDAPVCAESFCERCRATRAHGCRRALPVTEARCTSNLARSRIRRGALQRMLRRRRLSEPWRRLQKKSRAESRIRASAQ